MARRKVAVIGAGKVGSTTAQWIVAEGLADVALIDIVEGLPQGCALDTLEAAPVLGGSVDCAGGQGYDAVEGSDVVVITAGKPRTPGMSRDDLLAVNASIVGQVAEACAERAPNAVYIPVTNPLDAMAYVVKRATGADERSVVGMAGVLDTSRFRAFVGDALSVSPGDVQALVLGSHGDAMIPLIRTATVGGVPLTDLLSRERIEALVERTRKGGAEIVSLLKTGSACVAPSASVVEMVRSILLDQKRVLPCSVYLTGQYGIEDAFVGVPAVLGSGGAERVLEISLTDEELEALRACARGVREAVDRV